MCCHLVTNTGLVLPSSINFRTFEPATSKLSKLEFKKSIPSCLATKFFYKKIFSNASVIKNQTFYGIIYCFHAMHDQEMLEKIYT
jgi:hypothetical protein